MNAIERSIERILQFRKDRDWQQFHNPKDVAISLQLEASELLEHFQWKGEQEIAAYVQSNKSEIGDELADVLYWVLLLSHDLDIDLVEALNTKMDQNEKKYPVEKSRGNVTKYNQLPK